MQVPTELNDETGELIRQTAKEYGTTTGRARRCGWFDAVAARYSAMVNGFTSMALTRLDVLDNMPAVKICTGYRRGDETITHFPATIAELVRCQPVYEELPGWQKNVSVMRNFEELPRQARAYVERLEELTGCPASIISVGEHREQTIVRRPVP